MNPITAALVGFFVGCHFMKLWAKAFFLEEWKKEKDNK